MTTRIKQNFKIIIVGTRWVNVTAKEIEGFGYPVTVVETLDGLREHLSASDYALAILTADHPSLDNTYPGDGIMENLITEVRRKYPALGVVVMDGCDDKTIVQEYKDCGADEYISVPFELVDLIEALERIFQGI